MELMGDAMTAEFSIDEVAVIVSVVFDCFANFCETGAWFADINGFVHRFARHFRKILNIGMNITNHNHSRIISMVTVLIADNINVKVITILKLIIIGHSMTNHIINACAYTFCESMESNG